MRKPSGEYYTPKEAQEILHQFASKKDQEKKKDIANLIKASKANPRRKNAVENWKSLNNQLENIKAHCQDVINGSETGLYLFGRAGTGKTWTVKETFKEYCPDGYRYFRGAITPQGFFDLLLENSRKGKNRHIILDDVYASIKVDRNREYYLSALEWTDNMIREISYKKGGQEIIAEFGKGIVFISNEDLAHHKGNVIKAFSSRVFVIEHKPSDEEIWNIIFHIAGKSDNPKQYTEVANYLYDECATRHISPDIRMFTRKAMALRHSEVKSIHWKDRIISMLEQHAVEAKHEIIPASERKENLMKLAIEIYKQKGTGKVEKWRTATITDDKPKGQSPAYYYQLIELARKKGLLPPKK